MCRLAMPWYSWGVYNFDRPDEIAFKGYYWPQYNQWAIGREGARNVYNNEKVEARNGTWESVEILQTKN